MTYYNAAPYYIYGPLNLGWNSSNDNTGMASRSLTSTSRGCGHVFQLPKSGTINKVGFHYFSKVGSPPNLTLGIFTVDDNGEATTDTYGGSATKTWGQTTEPSGSIVWVTLDTPSSGSAGDLVAFTIRSNIGTPNTSNYYKIGYQTIGYVDFPSALYMSSGSWARYDLATSFCIQYDDGDIIGYPVKDLVNTNVLIGIGNRWGVKFKLPFSATIHGLAFQLQYGWDTNAEFNIALRNIADDVLSTSDTLKSWAIAYNYYPIYLFLNTPIELSADTWYRALIENPTDDLYSAGFEMQAEDDRLAFAPDENFLWTTSGSGGDYDDSETTYVPWIGLLLSDISADGGEPGTPASVWHGFIG